MKLHLNFEYDGLRTRYPNISEIEFIKNIYNVYSDFQHGLVNEYDRFDRPARWIEVDNFNEMFRITDYIKSRAVVDYIVMFTGKSEGENYVSIVMHMKRGE